MSLEPRITQPLIDGHERGLPVTWVIAVVMVVLAAVTVLGALAS